MVDHWRGLCCTAPMPATIQLTAVDRFKPWCCPWCGDTPGQVAYHDGDRIDALPIPAVLRERLDVTLLWINCPACGTLSYSIEVVVTDRAWTPGEALVADNHWTPKARRCLTARQGELGWDIEHETLTDGWVMRHSLGPFKSPADPDTAWDEARDFVAPLLSDLGELGPLRL